VRGFSSIGIAAIVATMLIGCAPAASPSPATVASASPSGAFGGSVQYTSDGAATTTEVDAVADGASVSGTAVTSGTGTHTVQLECAARAGDTWALAGTTEQTTLHDGKAGDWSAVIVKDGSPQQIAIWVSDPKSEGMDCDGWLAGIDFTTLPADALVPVESGALVPPPAS
jgi:hypothetical protein